MDDSLRYLGTKIKHTTLYHGSNIKGLRRFNLAEEDTVGSGVYLVPEVDIAKKYAILRSKNRKGTPVIYQCTISNMNIIDMTNRKKMDKILLGFAEVLEKQSKGIINSWVHGQTLIDSIKVIREKSYALGSLRKVTFSHTKLFSQYLQVLGYDGLIALEGGEGDMGSHNTWLIFDPLKVVVIKEIDFSDSFNF